MPKYGWYFSRMKKKDECAMFWKVAVNVNYEDVDFYYQSRKNDFTLQGLITPQVRGVAGSGAGDDTSRWEKLQNNWLSLTTPSYLH